MGPAPSGNGENPGKSAVAKVPVPIFSQPRNAAERLARCRFPNLTGIRFAIRVVYARKNVRIMILVVDNYDSFTFNLVQRLGEIDPSLDIQVHRNDQITVDEIEARRPSHLIISPGPCTPSEAGISVPCVERLAGQVADPRGLPGASVDWAGDRRDDRSCPAIDAWQDGPDLP
jgi:hypothetical protein